MPDAKRILDILSIPKYPKTYALGCYGSRVTFLSQQNRAFNLIWALFNEEEIQAGSTVGIVGAGIAGITAALAALSKGCKVTLYESRDQVLYLQRNNTTRHIHPYIFGWPKEFSKTETTDLPFLNWSAGHADDVVERLLTDWELAKDELTLELNSEVLKLEDNGGKPRVKTKTLSDQHDCVILAVGFGIEEYKYPSLSIKSYWDNDQLAQPVKNRSQKTFLVSGCGDGGLIDVLRLLILNFKQSNFDKRFATHPDLAQIKDRLLHIERMAEIHPGDKSYFLKDQYRDIQITEKLKKYILGPLRKDTKVYLNGPDKEPYNLRANTLNRFAVFLLRDELEYIPGKLTDVKRSKGRLYAVINKQRKGFDEVILRHGPKPAMLRFLRKKIKYPTNEITSEKNWPTDFFPDFLKTRRLANVSTIPDSMSKLIGRRRELYQLNDLLRSGKKIVSIVAWGGVGKTSLAKLWLREIRRTTDRQVLEWSFYFQGNNDTSIVSSEAFFEKAFLYFGHTYNRMSLSESGKKLARIVSETNSILVLDGLEPLQYSKPPLKGGIKDVGLRVFLNDLSSLPGGFILITTREHVSNFKDFDSESCFEIFLKNLDQKTAVDLLMQFELKGKRSHFIAAANHFSRHALSLILLGNWLHEVQAGNIHSYKTVKLYKQDEVMGNHAFSMMRKYDKWLDGSNLQLLRLLGFFNRPALITEIQALINAASLEGMNDLLKEKVSSDENAMASAITFLQDQFLLTLFESAEGWRIDTHPLIREYQKIHLRKDTTVWQTGNTILYEFISSNTIDLPETVSEILELYTAVHHGCEGGLYNTVLEKVFAPRIWQGDGYFSTNTLGVMEAELGALSNFYDKPFTSLVEGLEDDYRGRILSQTALCLKANYRITEAIDHHVETLSRRKREKNLTGIIINALNLSQLLLYIGKLKNAKMYAKESVHASKESGAIEHEIIWRVAPYTNLAMYYLEIGEFEKAREQITIAEHTMRSIDPSQKYLSTIRGYHQCELLLAFYQEEVVNKNIIDNQVHILLERRSDLATIEAIVAYGLETTANPYPRALYYMILAKVQIAKLETHQIAYDDVNAHEYLDHAEKALNKSQMQMELPRIYLCRAALYRIGARDASSENFNLAMVEIKKVEQIVEFSGFKLQAILVEVEKCRLYYRQKRLSQLKQSIGRGLMLVNKFGFNRYGPFFQLMKKALAK